MPPPALLQVVNGIKSVYRALLTSAGAGSSGAIPALDATGRLDLSFMPSGIGASVSPTVVASATISAGMLTNVYNNAGTLTVRPADNTNPPAYANSFATAAIANGASSTVTLSGIASGLSGMTGGVLQFLGTNGGVTVTAPSTAGYLIQTVGFALSASTLEFNPDPSPVTYA